MWMGWLTVELWGVQIVGMALAVLLAPLYVGIAQTVKARMQGRQGPSIWQGYWTLSKLWRKETLVPEFSSWVMQMAPAVTFGAMAVVVVYIPWGGSVPFNWPHDVLTVFFLLALERFWVGLAGLDSAGTFGGLGASRILTLGSGIEPALFAVFGLLWYLTGRTEIVPIAPGWWRHSLNILPWGLAVVGYVFVAMAELGRLPVDNPDTHLELTMMHEATVLEYSGRFLAQSQAAVALKFTAVIALGWVWLGPTLASPWWNLLLRIGELAVTSALLGWFESRTVKLRYLRLPAYLSIAIGMGMLAVYLVASRGGY